MTLRRRLQRLTGHRAGAGHEVWHQATDGRDVFTSDTHPGEVLTRDELEARPTDAGVRRIVVHRVDRSPAARDPW